MQGYKHSELVLELLRIKYPRYHQVTSGPRDCLPWEDKLVREKIEQEEKWLSTISVDGVQACINRERTKKASAEEAARFFNQPVATADHVYWASMNWWTAEEVTALLLDKSPEHVSWGVIEAAVTTSAFAHEFARLMKRVLRAPDINQLSDKKTPSEWMDWATENQLPVPPGLSREMTSRGSAIETHQGLKRKNDELTNELVGLLERIRLLEDHSQQRSSGEKSLQTRERDSLLYIIITMAIQQGYIPGGRNTLASQLSSRLDQLGLPLSDDTIRNHLSKAAELLPGSWQQKWTGSRSSGSTTTSA